MENLFNNILNIGLSHYLFLSLWLLLIGIVSVVMSHDMLKRCISLILILNAVNINLSAFALYLDKLHYSGLVVGIFISLFLLLQILILIFLSRNIFINDGVRNKLNDVEIEK